MAGNDLLFNAVVNKLGAEVEEATVTWSLSGENDTGNTTIDSESGLLTVSASETAESLTVTATYMDGSKSCTGSFTVTVPRGGD